MDFRNSAGEVIEVAAEQAAQTLLQGSVNAEPFELNLALAYQADAEWVVQLLEKMSHVKLAGNTERAMLDVVAELPDGAGLRDLIASLKGKDAVGLGVTPEEFEGLAPLLASLEALQAEGAYAHLFAQSEN